MKTLRARILSMIIGLTLGLSASSGSAASLNLGSQSLTPYQTCTLTATPATTAIVADATVRQASATSNFGSITSLTVSSSGAANQRTYARFDLSACTPAIATSAIVRIATLRVYMSAVPAACRTIDTFRVGTTWTETGITWNNQPFGTALNNPPTASRSDSFAVGTPVGCQNQSTGTYIVGAEVTTDVAAFVAGTASNFGWMLRDDIEGSATARTARFSSKQLGTVAQAPQLVITYVATP